MQDSAGLRLSLQEIITVLNTVLPGRSPISETVN